MLSLTVNTPNPLFSSTRRHHLYPPQPPPNPQKPPKALSISALIIPPSSSYGTKTPSQKVYQPYRPPPSSAPPPHYRNLDTNGRLDVLSNRLGSWFEYAPLITALINEGFTSSTLEEITGIASIEQNLLVVAAQVRDSLVELADAETVSFFNSPGSIDILYEIRILNGPERVLTARFIIENGFGKKQAEELARSINDFPRRYGDRGWDYFDGNSPGDCLAFMYFRQAHEHESSFFPELSKAALERALEVVETDRARQRIEADVVGGENKDGDGGLNVDDLVRVPVVRMAVGEVAESSVVVVLPVCREEAEVEEAPWEVGMRGEFGVVQAEKGWSRWVVLPGWGPVKGLKRGGVAVAFKKGRGVLPWRGKRRDANEEIIVVADRGRKEVESDGGFYLVVGEDGLRVERGVKLRESGVAVSLGTVVLVVRPPREDADDQVGDDKWD